MEQADKRKIAIYGSRRQEGFTQRIMDFIRTLASRNFEVYVETKLAMLLAEAGFRLQVHGVRSCTGLPEDVAYAVSIGGDGTFLRTVRWLRSREIPVLGINTGHLGFLAGASLDEADAIADMLASGSFAVERRSLLHAECTAIPASEWPYALNEVALLKGDTASMINVRVEVDGFHLADYKADGLIAATATGSTAYNLSVGGPILAPTLPNIILSPIAPHALTLRPIVIGGNSDVSATVTSRAADFRLSIDGRSFPVSCGVPVRIHRASHSVLTLRKPDENFASTLRQKLLWGQAQGSEAAD